MGVYNITKDLDDWNIDSPYSIGTIVSYDGKLYKAVKDVPVGINLGFNEYWEKLDTEEEIQNIKADLIRIDNEINYSSTEQIVGYYYDGKPIYRSIIVDYTLPSTSGSVQTFDVEHGIENIKKVIFYYGMMCPTEMTDVDHGDCCLIPKLPQLGGVSYAMSMSVYKSFIRLKVNFNTTDWKGDFYIYYTKTTDYEEEGE